ncbi:hypothetical protein GCM10009731_61750 [Streptomyces globosus]
MREEHLRRVIPQHTGHQVEDVTWSTAHGNLTRGPHILDWEGWGRTPYGYDAATLYLCALLVPPRSPESAPSWPPSRTGPRPASAC